MTSRNDGHFLTSSRLEDDEENRDDIDENVSNKEGWNHANDLKIPR